MFLLLFFFDFLGFFLRSTMHLNLPPTGVIAYLMVVPLLFLITLGLQKKGTTRKTWIMLGLFQILLILCLISTAASNNSGWLDYYNILLYLVYFTIGYYLYYFYNVDNNETDKITRFICNVTILIPFLLFIFIISNTQSGTYILDFAGEEVNYLRLAEGFAFLSFSAIVLAKKPSTVFAIITVSIISLFLINSRSALIVYIIAVVLLHIYMKGLKSILIIFVIVLLVREIISHIPEVMAGIEESRVGRLFFKTEADTSLEGRNELLEYGLGVISRNPITGEHNGHLKLGEGMYVHNILSYWTQFGFFAFFVLCVLLIISLKNIYENLKTSDKSDRVQRFAFMYLVYCIIGVIVSKAYVYNNIYLAVGLAAAATAGKTMAGRYLDHYIPQDTTRTGSNKPQQVDTKT